MSKHVVIVGASSGIGLALAVRLQKEGYRLTCVARRPCPLQDVRYFEADMADYHQRKALADELIASEEPPYALVYCAGTSLCAPVETTANDDYRYLWEVNYFGFAHLVQLLLGTIRQNKGRIVAVSSMAAVAPIPFDAHYGASKSALVAFATSLQAELKPYGAKVTAVLPGGVQTNFTFARKYYPADRCGAYVHAARNASATLENIEQRGMKAEEVAKAIQQVLENAEPSCVVPVGWSNAALYALCRRLPVKAQSKILTSLYATDRG